MTRDMSPRELEALLRTAGVDAGWMGGTWFRLRPSGNQGWGSWLVRVGKGGELRFIGLVPHEVQEAVRAIIAQILLLRSA